MAPELINMPQGGQIPVQEIQPQAAHYTAARTSIRGLSRLLNRRRGSVDINDTTVSEIVAQAESNLTQATVHEMTYPKQPELISTSENYNFLTDLLSQDSLQAYKSSLTTIIESDSLLSDYKRIDDAQLANSIAYNKSYREEEHDYRKQLDDERDQLIAQSTASSPEVRQKYLGMAEKIHQVDAYRMITMQRGTPEANKLIEYMSAAPAIQPEVTQPAPFVTYTNNTLKSWNVVDAAAVNEYLDERIFIPHVKTEAGNIQLKAQVGDEFDVPINLIVGAAGFDTWRGRATTDKSWGSSYGYGKMASLNVIKHYAGLPTELPPVSEMRVIVQPDGKILCDNGEGDSHRIAAAILRGDKTIKASSLSFKRIAYNVV